MINKDKVNNFDLSFLNKEKSFNVARLVDAAKDVNL